LKCVLLIKALYCGFGGKVCMDGRHVAIQKLWSVENQQHCFVSLCTFLNCILHNVWSGLSHFKAVILALPFVFQSDASFTSRRRPFPFSLIKKCRRVSVLLSKRQFGSWNSSSSCKQQQLDSPQAQRSSQWSFQIITSLGIYVIAARFQHPLVGLTKLAKRLSASSCLSLCMQQHGSRWKVCH